VKAGLNVNDERVAELGLLLLAEGFVPVASGSITARLRACARFSATEAERQMARRGIGKPGSGRRAGLAFLRNRREAVI
jgi:hypothetical protein